RGLRRALHGERPGQLDRDPRTLRQHHIDITRRACRRSPRRRPREPADHRPLLVPTEDLPHDRARRGAPPVFRSVPARASPSPHPPAPPPPAPAPACPPITAPFLFPPKTFPTIAPAAAPPPTFAASPPVTPRPCITLSWDSTVASTG